MHRAYQVVLESEDACVCVAGGENSDQPHILCFVWLSYICICTYIFLHRKGKNRWINLRTATRRSFGWTHSMWWVSILPIHILETKQLTSDDAWSHVLFCDMPIRQTCLLILWSTNQTGEHDAPSMVQEGEAGISLFDLSRQWFLVSSHNTDSWFCGRWDSCPENRVC